MHRHLDVAPLPRLNPWLIVLAVLSVLALISLAVLLYLWSLTSPTGASKTEFEVTQGMTVGKVLDELEQRKLIQNTEVARLVFRYKRTGGKLREGFYTLSGQQSVFEIADTLAGPGRPVTVRVTFPEGRRLRDVASGLARAGFGDYASNVKLLRDDRLSPYTLGKKSLEGFLFPDTYEVRVKDSPEAVVKKLLERGEQELTPANFARAKALGLTPYEWVTLASMVQAEAGSIAEMPRIAGVFFNRLDIGMRLQSDPTIAYGLNIGLPELDRSRGDFVRDTPYNSYTRAGLPPTPINNPGKAALEAVLKPERQVNGQQAMYFLHGKDGQLYVNANFDGHLRDVNRFR